MKASRNFPLLLISAKGERALKNGHPWVYDTEITDMHGSFTNGCLTDILSQKGTYLGTGFYSEKSKIRVRLLSSNANESFDAAFWKRRVKYALEYRRTVMRNDFQACRLIFGEADGMPGLTVDRYGDILVAQVLSYGMDLVKDTVFWELYRQLTDSGEAITGIFERNDVPLRELEGLPVYKEWYCLPDIGHPEKPSRKSPKTASGITWILSTGKKPDSFWTKNTTGVRSHAWHRESMYLIALHTPAPLP